MLNVNLVPAGLNVNKDAKWKFSTSGIKCKEGC